MLLTKEGPEIFDADSGPYFLFQTECDYVAFLYTTTLSMARISPSMVSI